MDSIRYYIRDLEVDKIQPKKQKNSLKIAQNTTQLVPHSGTSSKNTKSTYRQEKIIAPCKTTVKKPKNAGSNNNSARSESSSNSKRSVSPKKTINKSKIGARLANAIDITNPTNNIKKRSTSKPKTPKKNAIDCAAPRTTAQQETSESSSSKTPFLYSVSSDNTLSANSNAPRSIKGALPKHLEMYKIIGKVPPNQKVVNDACKKYLGVDPKPYDFYPTGLSVTSIIIQHGSQRMFCNSQSCVSGTSANLASIDKEMKQKNSPFQKMVEESRKRGKQVLIPHKINLSDQVMMQRIFGPLSPQPISKLDKIIAHVRDAVLNRKTFSIERPEGNKMVRAALLARGWVEKIYSPAAYQKEMFVFLKANLQHLIPMLTNKERYPWIEELIGSKLLGHMHQIDLFWSNINYNAFKSFPDDKKLTMINCIKHGTPYFNSKKGMLVAAKVETWKKHPYGEISYNHPRSYDFNCSVDVRNFLRDYNITAAISLLRWVVETSKTDYKIVSPMGRVPLEVLNFALEECECYLNKVKKKANPNGTYCTNYDWQNFLNDYQEVVHKGNHFKGSFDEYHGVVGKCKETIEKLKVLCPHIDMDGYRNIWMLKPSGGSCGVGIYLCRSLDFVLRIIQTNVHSAYVVQKYIDSFSMWICDVELDRVFTKNVLKFLKLSVPECPLLIRGRKFDIRQWFLISAVSPLKIWIYKEFYLRFSSQKYNIRKLHESIHLTNNSIQNKYLSQTVVDSSIPHFNMWTSAQFKKYLEEIEKPKAYDEIYNGICESIAATVLRFQHVLEPRRRTFHLFGADFMITEDYTPWLIEINGSPAMYPSTPITKKMCCEVKEDVIKVVVDYANRKTANTGHFEILYEEKPGIKAKDISKLQLSDLCLYRNFQTSAEKQKAKIDERQCAESDLLRDSTSSFSNEVLNVGPLKNYFKVDTGSLSTTSPEFLKLARNHIMQNPSQYGNLCKTFDDHLQALKDIKGQIKEKQENPKTQDLGSICESMMTLLTSTGEPCQEPQNSAKSDSITTKEVPQIQKTVKCEGVTTEVIPQCEDTAQTSIDSVSVSVVTDNSESEPSTPETSCFRKLVQKKITNKKYNTSVKIK